MCVCQTLFQRVIHNMIEQQGAGVCLRCLQPTKTHLSRTCLSDQTSLLLHLGLRLFRSDRWFMLCFKNTCCRPSAFQLPRMPDLSRLHSQPPCGTAPSVIPIQRGSNATSGRCALLALFLFFLSSCFSLLLPWCGHVLAFLFRVRVSENVVIGGRTVIDSFYTVDFAPLMN